MKKPEETVSTADLKRKIDKIVEEAKVDIRHPSAKFIGNAFASILASLTLSYFLGRRKGKKKAERKLKNLKNGK